MNTKLYIPDRVVATIIDYIIIFGLTFLYAYQFGVPNDEGGYEVTGWPALIPVGIWFVYIIIAEAFLGGTLGHQLLKLKVITMDNKAPSFGQTLRRRISDVLDIAWCFGFIAFILAKNTQYNQRLGDIWAKTLVIGKHETFSENQFDFESQQEQH